LAFSLVIVVVVETENALSARFFHCL